MFLHCRSSTAAKQITCFLHMFNATSRCTKADYVDCYRLPVITQHILIMSEPATIIATLMGQLNTVPTQLEKPTKSRQNHQQSAENTHNHGPATIPEVG
jgi:hypothetical protein